MTTRLRSLPVIATVGLALALTGCGNSTNSTQSAEQSSTSQSSETGAVSTGEWPRTIEHAAGSTTIDQAPVRIVSVSPSLTGTLLSVEAPVVASAGAAVTGMTNDQGFFTQWADVADERGVEVAYPNMELDLDAVEALQPDLIIGSANGGDSTLESYDQLSEIAPTVLLDYGSQSWQDVMGEVAAATGHEARAEEVLTEYDGWVSDQSKKITLPEQPVTAAVYLGSDGIWAFSDQSPQADLLTSLGFTYVNPVDDYVAPESLEQSVRTITAENMVPALAETNTLFSVDMGTPGLIDAIKADPLLANQVAVSSDRVYDMGTASFRLDYYAAQDTVEKLVEEFGN